MKKTLLTIASVAITVCAVAQRTSPTNNSIFTFNQGKNISITAKVAATACDTLSTITSTALAVPNGTFGYQYGTNSFGDLQKANFYPGSYYSVLSSPLVSGVIVGFYNQNGKGTKGVATNTVGMNLYSGSSATVAPGSATLGSKAATFAQIAAAHTNSASAVFLYTFDFLTPVSVPSTGFFASLVLPTTAGDTAAIVSQGGTATQMNFVWEKFSDNTWHSASETPASWGDSTSLFFLPKICGTVGVAENLGLSKNVTILPNPTSGLVNVAVILADKQNLTLTVTNALGQTLIDNKYNGISNELLSLDLSNFNNGVYFVTVSNGSDKMIQRLVLNK